MRLRTKIGSFIAVVCVVGAVGAAPANAAGTGINISSLSTLCKSIKNPKLAKACTDATAKLNTSKTGDFSSLLDKYSSLDSSSIQKLISRYTGGFDISKILAGLKL